MCVWRQGEEFKEPVSYGEFEERGEAEMHLAFCHKYPRLRERMAELHPALDRWMVDTVWGRLRSRTGLAAKERQLCALAALAGNIVWPQFKSSIIGAYHPRVSCRAMCVVCVCGVCGVG
jgi:alkylhydroperoxidase/carboxymuconolactone decarboxylase family protein YurZ